MKQRKERPGPFDYARKWHMQGMFWICALFLYAPIIILIIFSFNNAGRRGGNGKASLIEAFVNSLTIAVITTVLATILGALTAVVLWRWRFPLKPVYEGVVALPIVVPESCMGGSLAVFFAWAGWVLPPDTPWPLNLSNIILAHVTFAFPFAAMVIRTRLNNFNRVIDEAARDLGASEWQVFRDILLPWMRPGLVAGGLLAFTLSLDDFVITFFTSGPGTVTFPVKVYSMVRFSVTPEVNAASTVLVVITIIVTALAMRMQRPEKAEAK